MNFLFERLSLLLFSWLGPTLKPLCAEVHRRYSILQIRRIRSFVVPMQVLLFQVHLDFCGFGFRFRDLDYQGYGDLLVPHSS
jgi:hypothetical protein